MFKSLSLVALALSVNAMAATPAVEIQKSSIVKNYAALVENTYSESLRTANILKSDVENFLNNPGVVTMEVAKESWKKARAPYGTSEAFRFYNGPIDRDGGPEGLLNSWPLDEAYIDYVVGNPNAGIINDTAKYPEISKELLESLNELDGEKNISTGYHAIEFLLWGQDLNDDGPGNRPYTDYVKGKGLNTERRAQYLRAATTLLIENLEGLVLEWAPNQNNFRKEFETQDVQVSLKNIFNGIVFMAGDELSGERMYVAYETKGQEDEHSCFSDMTHMDIQWNFEGINNILVKTNLLNGVKTQNANLVAKVSAKLASTDKTLKNIPAPFDQALKSEEGLEAILAGVESLEGLAADLVKLAKEYDVKIDY